MGKRWRAIYYLTLGLQLEGNGCCPKATSSARWLTHLFNYVAAIATHIYYIGQRRLSRELLYITK